jgi:nucleoside phosphorylase
VNRNAIALDMEAAAFLQLCDYSDVIPLGVIKGVSDHGNAAKGKDPNDYIRALKNTGVALKGWIEHVMEKMIWQRDEGMNAGFPS